MKAKYIILSLLGAAALLFGCAKEPVTGYDNASLKVDNSYVRIDTLGGSTTIKLTAKEAWQLFVKTSYDYKYKDDNGKDKTKTVDTLITPGTSCKPHGIKDAVESWITADPTNGNEGEFSIAISAPAGTSYRTQDVRIVGESGAQIVLKVAQGEDVVKTYTVSQIIDLIKSGKAGGSPVLIKGIVCKIDDISTSYGNATYYISDDGTMKGSYTEDGGDGNWFEVYRGYWLGGEKFTKGDELAVGDKVTIKGTVTSYKGIPETNQNDSEVVEIEKSLVAVNPANLDVQPEGGVLEVAALYSGNNLTFDLDSAAVEFVSIVGSYAKGDTTFVKLRVDENKGDKPRSGVVFFTSSKPNDKDPKKTDSSTATVTVSQGIYAVKTIAELAAMFTSTSDQTFNADFAKPAVVTYVNGSNIFFKDDTGGILYYKPSADANTYAAGTTISGIFTGKGKLYSALPELTLITGGTLGTAAVPEIQTVTLAELNTNYNKYLSIPVKVVGITLKGSAAGTGKVNVTIEQGGVQMTLRTQVNSIKLTANDVGDAIVIPTLYNTTKQLGLWEQGHFTSTAN